MQRFCTVVTRCHELASNSISLDIICGIVQRVSKRIICKSISSSIERFSIDLTNSVDHTTGDILGFHSLNLTIKAFRCSLGLNEFWVTEHIFIVHLLKCSLCTCILELLFWGSHTCRYIANSISNSFQTATFCHTASKFFTIFCVCLNILECASSFDTFASKSSKSSTNLAAHA